MRFKEYLQEFRSNIPQGQMIDKDTLIDWVKNSKLLNFVILIHKDNVTEKDITLYDYSEFGPNDKFIILTDRKNKEEIIGYAWLNNLESKEKYWQVKDVAIFKQYQGKGIGTNLYIKLVKEGYKLMNGYSLSSDIEKVWRKLPKFVNVLTWDKQTDMLEPMNEKPKQDTNWDDKQRYFWVATSKDENLKESLWHRSDDYWFNEWINGRTSPSFGSEHYKGNY